MQQEQVKKLLVPKKAFQDEGLKEGFPTEAPAPCKSGDPQNEECEPAQPSEERLGKAIDARLCEVEKWLLHEETCPASEPQYYQRNARVSGPALEKSESHEASDQQ